MKARKTSIYSILAIFTCLIISNNVFGQDDKIQKTYQWKSSVGEKVSFTFNNYDCNMTIHTWDKSEIEYAMTVDATLKTDEDAKRLDAYIEGLEFDHSAGSLSFDNRFWSSKTKTLRRSTIMLKGEKPVHFREFKMKGELWIPKSCILTLQSKYSQIFLEDLSERLSLDLYNDKLYGGHVAGNIDLIAKYSTLELNNTENIVADLYNTNIEAGDIGTLNISSKYSNVKAGNAGTIDIIAYNDKYAFSTTGDISFTDKYSDLKTVKSGHLRMDCYNSNVAVDLAEEVDLKSKYGTYEIGTARKLYVSSGYNDKYELDSLGMINVKESKYSSYKILFLESTLQLTEGYSEKFFIQKTGAFKGLKIDGKYVSVEMALDKDLSYRFQAQVKYPKFEIGEENMIIKRKIKEGSELEMDAIKGVESQSMTSFFVNGYEMKLVLREY